MISSLRTRDGTSKKNDRSLGIVVQCICNALERVKIQFLRAHRPLES
jgi:hypothetical protein